MSNRQTLIEASAQVDQAVATLARYRALLSCAASTQAPAVQAAANDLRRVASQLECIAIGLMQGAA